MTVLCQQQRRLQQQRHNSNNNKANNDDNHPQQHQTTTTTTIKYTFKQKNHLQQPQQTILNKGHTPVRMTIKKLFSLVYIK